MKIEIELEDWQCEDILAANAYVKETVAAYYPSCESPYGDEFSYGVNTIEIAYHKLNRPKELDKERPMLENLNDFLYPKVVKELFVSRLWNVLYGD